MMKTREELKLIIFTVAFVVSVGVTSALFRGLEEVSPGLHYVWTLTFLQDFMIIHRINLRESAGFHFTHPFGFSLGMYSYSWSLDLFSLIMSVTSVFLVYRMFRFFTSRGKKFFE